VTVHAALRTSSFPPCRPRLFLPLPLPFSLSLHCPLPFALPLALSLSLALALSLALPFRLCAPGFRAHVHVRSCIAQATRGPTAPAASTGGDRRTRGGRCRGWCLCVFHTRPRLRGKPTGPPPPCCRRRRFPFLFFFAPLGCPETVFFLAPGCGRLSLCLAPGSGSGQPGLALRVSLFLCLCFLEQFSLVLVRRQEARHDLRGARATTANKGQTNGSEGAHQQNKKSTTNIVFQGCHSCETVDHDR